MKIFSMFGEIFIKTDKAIKGLKATDEQLSSVGAKAKATGKTVAKAGLVIGGALVAFGFKAVQAAADVEEMENKFNVVFSGMTTQVDSWADNFADKVGRSKNDTKGFLANISDLLIGMGNTQDEAFGLSTSIVELATDLASFNNVNDEVAIEAVSKAMMGEAESAKQLGLLLNIDRVKDFAEAQGILFDELNDAEKAALTFELAVSQSQNAMGDAERSSGSYTNQMKALQAQFKDFMSKAGTPLLEMATKIVKFLGDLIDKTELAVMWVKEHETVIQLLAVVIGTITALLILLKVQLVLQASATTLWAVVAGVATTATTALGTAFKILSGPVGIIILIIGALIAIGILVVKNWDKIKEFAIKIWNSIADFFKKLWEDIKNIFKKAWEFIKNLFFKYHPLGILIKHWDKVADWFKNLGKNIKQTFVDMINKAKTWGRDLIQGFINGIKAKLQALKDMVARVARTVKNFLGFSVPDKGPLSDADQYGGDFIDLFVDKIRANKNKLINEVSGLASSINLVAQPALAGAGGGITIKQTNNFSGQKAIDPIQSQRTAKKEARALIVEWSR